MNHDETMDALYEYANKREHVIPGGTKGVRTYQAWCDQHDEKHTIACTQETGNPYEMLETARFNSVYVPLLNRGILSVDNVIPRMDA